MRLIHRLLIKFHLIDLGLCAEKDCKFNINGECHTTKLFTKESNYSGELFCATYECRKIFEDSWGSVDQKGIISFNRG